jgi:hypothetical protein
VGFVCVYEAVEKPLECGASYGSKPIRLAPTGGIKYLTINIKTN